MGHQQSYNPLVPELFLYLLSNRCPIFGDARRKWVKEHSCQSSSWSYLKRRSRRRSESRSKRKSNAFRWVST